MIRGIRDTGAIGEISYSEDHVLPQGRHRVLPPELWMGVSQPGPADVAARDVDRRSTGSCGAATTRTTRARARSRASTCGSVFHDVPETELREILAGNAAKLYDFDLDALAPLAAQYGPTVDEIAEPIDAVPDKTLQRLSEDMDPKAIK